MSQKPVHPVDPSFAATAHINADDYQRLYAQSIEDPETFWREQAACVDWIKPFTKVKDVSFEREDFHIRWYEDGELNISANCLDRHLEARGDKTAIIWEGDNPAHQERISFRELHRRVCRMANALKAEGVNKGDRVTLYMPMIPDAAVAMLACTRIGAVHSIVFGGFSPDALAGRISDCQSTLVITADEGLRGGRKVPLKANVDAALKLPGGDAVKRVVVTRHTGGDIEWNPERDRWMHELTSSVSEDCAPEPMNAEDPLFILYTSGSTGKPKGVLHTTGGYLVYGPLSNAVTTVMFEGVPNHPDIGRFWQVVDKHQVSIFYTAPTAIRALMREGDEPVRKHSRKSLRLLGSVGEPINPEAWDWYWRVVGEQRCPVVDTWWQTETGGVLISPLPGATDLKPGSASKPFFGVQPALVDAEGTLLEGPAEGNLVLLDSWPGQMRTVYGDHPRFIETYFTTFPGTYFTGDGARRDEDGYWWITGRVDDVLNVSGHRMGTAEIESALVAHPSVAEAAVVGCPHKLKGQGIYVYVTLNAGVEPSEELRKALRDFVRHEIGPIASPDVIQWAPGLPKTRSGKIMRRILRKIAAGEIDTLGDTSTLADPGVVDNLIEGRQGN